MRKCASNLHTTYSEKDISPSLFVSNNMKNFDGAQFKSPGCCSPRRCPSLTKFDSDGGNTGTTALIKSAGYINTSPSELRKDAKYSKILESTVHIKVSIYTI